VKAQISLTDFNHLPRARRRASGGGGSSRSGAGAFAAAGVHQKIELLVDWQGIDDMIIINTRKKTEGALAISLTSVVAPAREAVVGRLEHRLCFHRCAHRSLQRRNEIGHKAGRIVIGLSRKPGTFRRKPRSHSVASVVLPCTQRLRPGSASGLAGRPGQDLDKPGARTKFCGQAEYTVW
jgi:hypothetical protein